MCACVYVLTPLYSTSCPHTPLLSLPPFLFFVHNKQARGESTREGTMAERIEGLGAAPAKRHDHVPKMTVAEQELHRLERDAQAQRLTQTAGSSSSSGGGEGYFTYGPGGGSAGLSKKEAKVCILKPMLFVSRFRVTAPIVHLCGVFLCCFST